MITERTRPATKRRLDYELIEALVPEGSRVLDLGCGDGQLLAELAENKGCLGRGIDISEQAVPSSSDSNLICLPGSANSVM